MRIQDLLPAGVIPPYAALNRVSLIQINAGEKCASGFTPFVLLRIRSGDATPVAPMQELKKSQSYGPDVRLTAAGVVEKTYRARILPVRLIGGILIAWEAFIYAKLDGITGIPTLLGRPDRYTILTAFMGGENLRETTRTPDAAYFEKMGAIIRQMHARGVIHLDMRNRRNYGLDPAGEPYLVDFASAGYLPWPKSLRTLLCRLDWLGFVKVKGKLAPELLSADERHAIRTGETLSSIWLPTKAFNAVKDAVKRLKRSPRDR